MEGWAAGVVVVAVVVAIALGVRKRAPRPSPPAPSADVPRRPVEASDGPRAWLVFAPGSPQELVVPITQVPFLIGAARHCDVQVKGTASVGGEQCRIDRRDGRWVLCVPERASGTMVDETLVDGPHPLTDGSHLLVSEHAFVFRLADGP